MFIDLIRRVLDWRIILEDDESFQIEENARRESKAVSTETHDNEYCLRRDFLHAQKPFPTENGLIPITLATHGTSETIDFIEQKAATWDGPISFALFLDFHSRLALQYVMNVHRCNKEFREKVSVHIGFRISPFQKECQSIEFPEPLVSCREFLMNQETHRKQIDGSFGLYPINMMRNLARDGAPTDLHFLLDADMIVSEGFAEKVKGIANRMIDGKSKNALVIRRFETETTPIPTSINPLKMAFENKTIFEFHHKFFFVGHQIPNITLWFERSRRTHEVESWEIPYLGAQWEPQTIVHRNSEYNSEYIPPRIRDMQCMIYKLCRANYTFHLLSQVFTVHQGIKRDDTMFSKVVADHSKKYKRQKAFNRYVKEMDARFPDTLDRCGKFQM